MLENSGTGGDNNVDFEAPRILRALQGRDYYPYSIDQETKAQVVTQNESSTETLWLP